MKNKEATSISFVTNIIAPYRVDLFNELSMLAQTLDIDLTVYFMRETESNRSWRIDKKSIKFTHYIGHGLYLHYGRYHFHFTPLLIIKAIRSKSQLILGSSWNDFNVLLVIILKKMGLIKQTIHMWTEANHQTIGARKQNYFKSALRAFVFSSVDGFFIIPGKMAEISLEKWGVNKKPLIRLPNLVSKARFAQKSDQGNSNKIEKPKLLIVARLKESEKGIIQFLNAIGLERIKKITIKIIGSGPDRSLYDDYIYKNKLHNNVFLSGELPFEQLPNAYDECDIFVLPSISDPSPLAVVEALCSGKPLLISNKCGNHYETVAYGENGYTFDPEAPEDVCRAFDLMIQNRESWAKFSQKSLAIADENFDNTKILTTLLQTLALSKSGNQR